MAEILLEEELHELDIQVMRLGSLVEDALAKALEALEAGNQEEADAVIVSDDTVDELRTAIEDHIFQISLLKQSLTRRDARYLISVLPVTIDLERIGDEAEDIALIVVRMIPLYPAGQRAQGKNELPSTAEETHQATESAILRNLLDVGREIRVLLHDTMKAFQDRDIAAARDLWQKDRVITRRYYRVRRELTAMFEGHQAASALAHDPHSLQRAAFLHSIAHELRRIADHCTNVCERIVFIAEGDTEMAPLLE